MRAKTTLLLFLLVILLAAAIVGIERFLPSTRDLREMKKGPVQFDRSKITQIELDSSGGDGVSLAWDGAQWWVRRPFNDLADPEKAGKLLAELLAIGWIQRVHKSEFDDSGWARTGLDKPGHKLRLMAGGTQVLECWVGAQSPFAGSYYLTLQPAQGGGEAAHYVARTTLPDLLKAAPKEWRDGKLLRLPAGRVASVKLIQTGGQIEITRKSEKAPWMLVKPLSGRGSKEKINELLATLLNLVVTDAVEPVSGAGMQTTGATGAAELTAQELKISVTVQGLAAPLDITLKKPVKDAAETTARVSYRKPVFTVLSKSIADLWAQPNDLRDRMLASIDEDEVTAVTIVSPSHLPVELEKHSNSWFVRRKDKLEPANGDKVYKFFHAVNTHEVAEFTADTASNLTPYGLDDPFRTVSWTEAGAKVKLLLGKNSESTEFFAKYDGEPSVFRIDASLLPSIPADSIKWKGLGVLRFTQFALRSIRIAVGTAPPLVLNYDPTTAAWTGEIAGRDITAQLDRVKADRKAGELSKFSVQDWSSDITNAIHALQTPALQVTVTLGEPGTNTGPTKDTVINFAPTHGTGMDSAMFYGQVQGSPDVFYISRAALMAQFATSPLKD